jgi:hypothetical protein
VPSPQSTRGTRCKPRGQPPGHMCSSIQQDTSSVSLGRVAGADFAIHSIGRVTIRRPVMTAGEGIRTLDVQLGKNEPAFSDWVSKLLFAAA